MLSNLYARVSARLGDPVIRGRALALFAGKMIGLILLVAAMKMVMGSPVQAADGGPTPMHHTNRSPRSLTHARRHTGTRPAVPDQRCSATRWGSPVSWSYATQVAARRSPPG